MEKSQQFYFLRVGVKSQFSTDEKLVLMCLQLGEFNVKIFEAGLETTAHFF